MKIIFISNYFTHHQEPFCTSLSSKEGVEFVFLETGEMDAERIRMGWSISCPDYVFKYKENEELWKNEIYNAEVVIFGDCPYRIIKKRINDNKITFYNTERIYRNGLKWYKWPRHSTLLNLKYNRSFLFLLCSSAYTYYDFIRLGLFRNKAYKWGYFPVSRVYKDFNSIIKNKEKHSILWCARFIDFKHPETAISIAKNLKDIGCNFTLRMIGDGILLDQIKERVHNLGLDEYISFLGSITPNEVRDLMEKSEVFIFTSDQREGWGAVVNEAMNSGCIVIADSRIGSVPYLVKNSINGYIYKEKDVSKVPSLINDLFENENERIRLSTNAYRTIAETWNANNAADNFVRLVNSLKGNSNSRNQINIGPGSPADIIKDGWFNES